MNPELLLKLEQELNKLPVDESQRLIIHTKSLKISPVSVSPDSYSSRLEYRKAMINVEKKKEKPSFEALLEKLGALSLTLIPFRQSNMIVLEGVPGELMKAMEYSEVERAFFDEEIELIRPFESNEEENFLTKGFDEDEIDFDE